MKECVTHHICDCQQEKLNKLIKYKEDIAELYREVDRERNDAKSEVNRLKAELMMQDEANDILTRQVDELKTELKALK